MRYIKVGYILIFLFLILFPLLILPRLIKISKISCFSQYGDCSKNIQEKFNQSLGKSYWEANKEIKDSLAKNLLVKEYSLQFKLPAEVRVDIILNKPKYALKNPSQKFFYLVDKDGKVLAKENSTELPYVEVNNLNYDLNQKIKDEEIFSLEIIYDLFNFYQVKSGKIEGDSLMVNLSEGPKVIFPLSGSKDALIGALRLILSRLNEPNKDVKIDSVKEIDLRFKNPVLK